MRKYSNRVKRHSKRVKRHTKMSKKIRGGNRFTNFFGFGKPGMDPSDAQAQQVIQTESNEVDEQQQIATVKQQQAAELRNKCKDYQTRAEQLDKEGIEHENRLKKIIQTRQNKNKCDTDLDLKLQGIEQEYEKKLYESKQQAQQEHANCLKEGMNLLERVDAMSQLSPQANKAATAIQASRRGQVGRRDTPASPNGLEPLNRMPVTSVATPVVTPFGSTSSIRGGRKSRIGGRKSRRGGSGCGTHQSKMMYGGRKHRRGGTRFSS